MTLWRTRSFIEQAVQDSGQVTQGRERFFADLVLAAAERTTPSFRTIAPLMDKQELAALGLRGNTRISKQFYESLNGIGRTDPIQANRIISNTIMQRTSTARARSRAVQAVGDYAVYRLLPSNMAAGPCESAQEYSLVSVKVADAADLPLPSCDKLGQCGCFYRLEAPDRGGFSPRRMMFAGLADIVRLISK